jgi:hypothetical protein
MAAKAGQARTGSFCRKNERPGNLSTTSHEWRGFQAKCRKIGYVDVKRQTDQPLANAGSQTGFGF